MHRESPLRGKYDQPVDSESAYELLAKRKELAEAPAEAAHASGGLGGLLGAVLGQVTGGGAQKPAGRGGRQRLSTTEIAIRSAATSMARTVGTQVGRAILRNVLGSITRG